MGRKEKKRIVSTFRVFAITKVVLLSVRRAENPVTDKIDGEDCHGVDKAQVLRMKDEVTGLQRVYEGDPDKISECKHETKTIRDDVHSGKNRRL